MMQLSLGFQMKLISAGQISPRAMCLTGLPDFASYRHNCQPWGFRQRFKQQILLCLHQAENSDDHSIMSQECVKCTQPTLLILLKSSARTWTQSLVYVRTLIDYWKKYTCLWIVRAHAELEHEKRKSLSNEIRNDEIWGRTNTLFSKMRQNDGKKQKTKKQRSIN